MACRVIAVLAVSVWMTSFHQPEHAHAGTPEEMVSLSCMYGFGITGVKSKFDDMKKDRQWELQCSRIGAGGSNVCEWSRSFVNSWRRRINHQCAKVIQNGYISGVYSDFDWASRDRRWRFECCSSGGVVLSSCQNTSWLNGYKEALNFTVPSNHAITGIISHYRSEHSDRRWKFSHCEKTTPGA